MHPTKDSQHLSSLHPSFLPTTLANPGDILFSTTATNRRSNSFLQPSISSRYHQNTSVFSLVDPNIELPTISANEVEQVFNQLQSTNASQPTSRKTTGYWLSKDDSFTPPPIKRSFGGCITPAVSCSNNPVQTQQPSQIRTSSLVAALQLPSLGSVNSNSNSSSSPPLHAALRRQLLAPLNTLTNLSSAAKQRQENLTVRLANRAKLTSAARIPVVTNGSSVESECTRSRRRYCRWKRVQYVYSLRLIPPKLIKSVASVCCEARSTLSFAPFPISPNSVFLPYLTDGVAFIFPLQNPDINPTFQSFNLPVVFATIDESSLLL
nr:hypothetical transcript [Hymenolepis microstoma]